MSTEVLLKALAQGLTTDESLVLYNSQGKARLWKPGTKVPPAAQSVSIQTSMGAGLALIVDVDRSNMRKLTEPTFAIETSPRKSCQLWYVLHAPERNPARFGAAVRAFVHGGLTSNERAGQLNGTLLHHAPNLRFTTDMLFKAFH